MSELLITSSLDPIKEGDVFEKNLPRHLTIWQYFQLPDLYVDHFVTDINYALQTLAPVTIIGTEAAEYGPNNDVPVRRVEALGGAATLATMHHMLGDVIDRYDGVVRNPEWSRDRYNPHITYVDGRALEEGEEAELTTVELIERLAPAKRKIVRKVWTLEDNHEASS